ncbi:hypothetical protein TCAL_04008 [Tigriopus californicus]|uniref:Ig-like domain-containing protein n=1 Tax=Tigriopus californicus TaxID=6832 RepID=A0A553NFH9_TIGCA|nr:leucine-rich repeats and immunoglobulin-like domains protein 2 [Tigriopus californicus]TRY64155.1 hypothetical protein TCAL_04008 [Tigriopus californicus]|eukprot:TCALIF_04008-PA protein Name:"Similar to LRIG3 Leucine-rich repeats and immunoglobulin-like domains protein 3 (Homo sapiens)" AED:0.21 eAED:0.21 QI:1382/1/1/1/1/1/3/224/1255
MASSSPGETLAIICSLVCLLSMIATADGSDGALSSLSVSCDPRVCTCNNLGATPSAPTLGPTANCSGRGLLAMPTDLPISLVDLSLSFNALAAVNTTELKRLAKLRRLDLSHNRLSAFFGDVHFHLEYLDLSYNDINSVRSLRLESLVGLTHLHLANNQILSLPSDAFPASKKLKTLNLRNNKIMSLEPGSLNNLNALEELVLTKNNLSSFPKGLFKELTNLRILELNKNLFVEIQGLAFHGLINLKTLRLKRNQIEYLSDGAFFGLSAIEEINLDRNSVDRIGKGWLYEMGSLKYLSMAFNHVDYIDDESWEFCKNLTDIDLRRNRLQLLGRDFLRKLPRLQRLNLQNNMISHIQDDDTFAEVPNLETLLLDGNEISHTIEDMTAPFNGLALLKRLSLSRNPIRSVGGKAFYGLENLEELDLTDAPISTIKENTFSHLSLLHTIKMDSSSILCDCYVKWFPKWLNETGIRGCEATCAHPENLKVRLITSIDYARFTCDDFPKPYILEQPKTQITLKGENLTLFCRAASTSPAEMEFEWKIDSEVIDYPVEESCGRDDVRRCIRNEKHSFDGKGKEITSSLNLFNLTYDDAGHYQCVVTNRYGATYSDKANITVYVYPQFVVTPEDITVQGGATASLKCMANGVPAPKLSWSKDEGTDFPAAHERRITVNNYSQGGDQVNMDSFSIYNVKAVDMGTYQCKASNPAGSISWNISLTVLEVPRFVKPMENKSVPEGETVVIECQATGSPKPQLSWTKDGGPFVSTERHFFTAANQKLIIMKVKPSDSGKYECSIHNQLGQESQSSLVEVLPNKNSDFGAALTQDQTLFIIILVLVCCLIVTSLIWVFVLVKIRQRRRRRQNSFVNSHRATSTPNNYSRPAKTSTGNTYPLTLSIGDCPAESEFDIETHVRQGLIPDDSASSNATIRNPQSGVLTTDLKNVEDTDERDSGTGDSKDHPDDSQRLLLKEEPQPLVFIEENEPKGGGGESAISLSEFEMPDRDIPLMDTDDSQGEEGGGEGTCAELSEDDEASLSRRTATLEDGSTSGSNGPVSFTDSVPKENGNLQIPFQTFHPKGRRQRQISELVGGSTSFLDQHDLIKGCDTLFLDNNRHLFNGTNKQGRKRASTVELNGKCFLAIEPEPPDRTSKLVPPEEYRGGQGTLPRNGLDYQQSILEASLNSSDYLNNSRLSQQPLCRSNRSSSRNSLFDRARKSSSRKKRGQSLPRRTSKQPAHEGGAAELVTLNPDHSAVVFSGKEMFG